MKNRIILITISLLTSMAIISCSPNKEQPVVSIIPRPVSIEPTDGVFRLTDGTSIVVSDPGALKDQVSYLQSHLGTPTGFTFPVANEASGKSIVLKTDGGLKDSLGEEGYRLVVEPKRVNIEAATPAGVFYGIQTLLQLLPTEIFSQIAVTGTDWILPCVTIADKPRFVWRGFMLDVSRHFFPPQYIYDLLDHLAINKMNHLHLHLVDDQGWRIEIKKYPKLTQVGAWRADREDKPWNSREPQKPGEKATYGGFYTQEDIRNFVAYAAARNITIVPEIEMPAHTTSSLAAYPEFSCTGKPVSVLPGGIWPCSNIYCAGKEETFSFLEDVLTEVMDLFPSEYIHIGGDEADKTQWKSCPACQRRIRTEGLKNENELQSYFIRRIEKFINAKGRKIIGWDEILEGGLAPNAAVMSWRGMEGGVAAAKAGHPVVMTPTGYCYFDYYQGNPEDEPNGIGGYLPLEKVYSFEPVPEGLTPEEARMILGAQANLWTEYVSDTAHANYMTFPRLTALAEVDWTPADKKDFDDFSVRLVHELKRFDAMGLNYSTSFSNVTILPGYSSESNEVMVTLKSGFPGTEIHFTTDGSDPKIGGTVYTAPFPVKTTTEIRAVAFLAGKALSSVSTKKIIVHLASGKKIAYASPYSDKYTGGGPYALVDGIRGSINFSDGSWQGFEGKDLDATVDLGSPQTVSKLTLGTLQANGSWIFLPAYVEFALATEPGKFTIAGRVTNTIDPREGDRILHDFTLEIPPQKARYVRVFAKNIGKCPPWHAGAGNPAWLFADELIVE